MATDVRIINDQIKEIIDRFARKTPAQINEMKTVWERHEIAPLLKLIHRFKGTSANCGLEELEHETLLLEDELRGQCRPQEVNSHFGTLQTLAEKAAGT